MVDTPDTPREQEQDQQQTPQKTYQNGVRTNGRAFNSANWRMKGEESPSASPMRTSMNTTTGTGSPRGLGFGSPRSQGVPPAITEGRRLYVGNMPYTAKMEDVQALFNAGGFEVSRIDIAIDSFSGRNPSYCFVDLETKELCERAMAELDGGDLLGRPVKIKPGVVKSASERQQRTSISNGSGMGVGADGSSSPRGTSTGTGSRSSPFNADRWRRDDSAPSTPTKSNSNSTSFSNSTSIGSANTDSSRRLYVGNLPRLTDQESITSNITSFFKEYSVSNVSKLFTPHPAKRFEPGDHYYLFVDFATVEDAQNAMAALNGTEGPWGGVIRVQRARGETSTNNTNSTPNASGEKTPRSRWGSSLRTGPEASEGVQVEA
ncbi:hypothetical protein BJX99DRAFT_236656 [Aspergillus californicus]